MTKAFQSSGLDHLQLKPTVGTQACHFQQLCLHADRSPMKPSVYWLHVCLPVTFGITVSYIRLPAVIHSHMSHQLKKKKTFHQNNKLIYFHFRWVTHCSLGLGKFNPLKPHCINKEEMVRDVSESVCHNNVIYLSLL